MAWKGQNPVGEGQAFKAAGQHIANGSITAGSNNEQAWTKQKESSN